MASTPEPQTEPQYGTVQWEGRTIRFVVSGRADARPVLFIHGAPGSIRSWSSYLTDPVLADAFHLIAYDRPGYGNSAAGGPVPALSDQMEAAFAVLDAAGASGPPLVLGHSYGGTVAARMAMADSASVREVLLLAPAIDPENERFFFFNRPLEWRALNWLLPGPMRTANREKVTHVAELTAMLPLWASISVPVTVIHGAQDPIVPVANGRFAAEAIRGGFVTYQELPDANHFLPWNRDDLVRGWLLERAGR